VIRLFINLSLIQEFARCCEVILLYVLTKNSLKLIEEKRELFYKIIITYLVNAEKIFLPGFVRKLIKKWFLSWVLLLSA
jgi:hypothetical protein